MTQAAPRRNDALHVVHLTASADFETWRTKARALALARIEPSAVEWRVDGDGQSSLFAAVENEPPPEAPGATLAVPRSFLERAETVPLPTLLEELSAPPAAPDRSALPAR